MSSTDDDLDFRSMFNIGAPTQDISHVPAAATVERSGGGLRLVMVSLKAYC